MARLDMRPGYRLLAPVALLAVLILSREVIQKLAPGWFQLRSAPGQVRHVTHPVEQSLGGGGQPQVMLLGWELLSGPLRPGDTLRLRLYWQSQGRIGQDLHSLFQLYTPSLRQGWAGVQNEAPGRLPTSRWRRALYYVDDLALELPDALAPTTYTLAVGLVDDEGRRLEVAGNPDGLVLLDEVEIEPSRAGWRQPLRPTVAVPASFGPDLQLQGYDLVPEAGGPILRLFWHVRRTPGAGLATFVHMVDEQGRLVAQFDGPPLHGLLPSDRWQAGSLLIDERKLAEQQGLPGGRYRLLVGLYSPATGERLLVQRPDSSTTLTADALVIPLYAP